MIINLIKTIVYIIKQPLNKGRGIKAIIHFLKWQIGIRLLKKKIIVPWVDNSTFIVSQGETGLTGNLYSGLMEYNDMLFVLHVLKPTHTFIDVGANVGAYTILASKVVQSKSIAFEPLSITAKKLNDQININEIHKKVKIINKGVSNEIGELTFTNNKDTMNQVCMKHSLENVTRAKVTTLDKELNENNDYVIKIDVEGFEYNVILGAEKTLSSKNIIAIIIELNGRGEDFGFSDESVHLKLIDLNYIPVLYNPIKREISNLKSYNKYHGNTIYIKDLNLISSLCKQSPKRVIHTAGGIEI